MITNIVFDFDGTLVDSNQIKRNAFFEVARQLGPVDEIVKDVLTNVKGDRAILIKSIIKKCSDKGLLKPGISLDELEDLLVKDYSTRCEEAISACLEISGAYSTLSFLRENGYSLFLNSATPLRYLRRIVELRKLTPFFKGIYGAPLSKLDNLNGIKKDFNITDNHSFLLVGDGEDDLQAAAAFPCSFVGVIHDKYQFSKSIPLQVKNMEELPNILKKVHQ